MTKRLIDKMMHNEELQITLAIIPTMDYRQLDAFVSLYIDSFNQQIHGMAITIDAFIAAFPEIKDKPQFIDVYNQFAECSNLYREVDNAIEKQLQEVKP